MIVILRLLTCSCEYLRHRPARCVRHNQWLKSYADYLSVVWGR